MSGRIPKDSIPCKIMLIIIISKDAKRYKIREKMGFESLFERHDAGGVLTDGGRWYQRRGAEIEKARSPVRVRDLGILHKMPLDHECRK